MGWLRRDIVVTHQLHEIGLTAAASYDWTKISYKLAIDGTVVDEQVTSAWRTCRGGAITLEGRLPNGQTVRAVAALRLFWHNDYRIFVEDDQIHRERATIGGL